MKEVNVAHKVRTTIQPDVELEVDDAELQALRAQGLLLDTKAKTNAGARRAAERNQQNTED